MHKPSLSRMWETFIQLPTDGLSFETYIRKMRFELRPVVSRLLAENVIDWYCFLVHDKSSGVPTTSDDAHPYFHIRFALKESVNPTSVIQKLPDYCVMTAPIALSRIESITGIDKASLKNEDIEEAWRIIGQQSEWVLEMLSVHKDDTGVTPYEIAQLLHFFDNMTQLSCAKRTVPFPFDDHGANQES